jgi:cell division protein FtsB
MVGGSARGYAARGQKRIDYRRRRVVAAVGFALLIGWIAAVFAMRGFTIVGLRTELTQLRVDQGAALTEQAALRENLALKDDPQTIEDYARERLGLVMPGEEKVIFDREESP